MRLRHAKAIADGLVNELMPYCERIEIAGSIRRRVANVKDIELVLIPRWEVRTREVGLFAEVEPYRVNVLHEYLTNVRNQTRLKLDWIKPATDEIITNWPIKPEGRYWRGLIWGEQEIKLDVFLTAAERWGATLIVRTGSAEFSHKLVTHAQKIDRPFDKGSVTIAGLATETREEADVFRVLGLVPVPPTLRVDGRYLRPMKVAK